MALTDIRWLALLTPLGGFCFLAGCGVAGYAPLK